MTFVWCSTKRLIKIIVKTGIVLFFQSRRQNGPETRYKTKDQLTDTEQFLYNRAADSKINSKGDTRAGT
jgi:hypothetical protein